MYKLLQWTLCMIFLCTIKISHSAAPLWTFTPEPGYPTTLSLTPLDSATVVYAITNQSRKTHHLRLQPISGVTQITSEGNCPSVFTLKYRETCLLSLFIYGSLLNGSLRKGPVICQQDNPLQCYQPSMADALNITLLPIARYLITPIAGEHGAINPSTPQTVLTGSHLTFTAMPDHGFQVDQWLVDNILAQTGGNSFTLSQIDSNHTVEATFTQAGTIFAGTAKGTIYFSMNHGLSWTKTTTPSSGFAVNSLFATTDTLYAGSADGKVYYSANNGNSWNATSPVPGHTEINSIFIAMMNHVATIYAGTQNGQVYYSTNGTTWNATTNPGSGSINSLFITPDNILYAGSGDGNVYSSSNNGDTWIQISGPEASSSVPIQNVFAVNHQLYVNTRKISDNTTLPMDTVDFEYSYVSNSQTDPNPTWTLLSQITYTLFVNSDASVIYAGTQDGYLFSLTTGDQLGFITRSPIASLFFLN